MAQILVDSGPGIVVVTLGAAGRLAHDGNRVWRQPSRPIKVVDTLGAGDAIAGISISDWLMQPWTPRNDASTAGMG
ncbi:MAG: PfkB family carbohydrate kinase [Bacillota bacterium]|jgi:sugar/nucleoside kinase (ribokinase family)